MIKTAKDIQSMVNNPDNVKVVRTLFAAVAYCETVRDVVVPKQKEILGFYRWTVSQELRDRRGFGDEPVLEPKRSYLLSEDDFRIYDSEMQNFYKESGFKNPPGHCPLLIAESTVREVKRHVANFLEPYFGFNYDKLITGRLSETADKYFQLIMEVFAEKVKELETKQPFLEAA